MRGNRMKLEDSGTVNAQFRGCKQFTVVGTPSENIQIALEC